MRRLAALAAVVTVALCAAPAARADFGIADFKTAATQVGGGPVTLSGAHPHALVTEIDFEPAAGGGSASDEDVRDLHIEMPPGLILNPTAATTCSQAEFHTPRSSPYAASLSGEDCPIESQVGTLAVQTGTTTRHFGLFNLVSPPGYPSRIGAAPFGAPLFFTLRPHQEGGEFRLSLSAKRITQLFDIAALDLEFWGTPWATAHDGKRGDCLNEINPAAPPAQCPVSLAGLGHPPWAYLTMPSTCAAPLDYGVVADSWQRQGAYLPSGDPDLSSGAWSTKRVQAPALQDCESLGFFVDAAVVPSSGLVSSPTGLSFRLSANQGPLTTPGSRFYSRIKKAVIDLPAGMSINPSVGAGLDACTPAQFAAETVSSPPGAGCPNPSKVGTATVDTPLVDGGALTGSLFIAKPFDNPFGSPYALYFVAKSSERGFIVKVPGKLDADPSTGRLVATFDNLPQLPYTNLRVDFREGQRAPLVSPGTCGIYASAISLHPWVDPQSSVVKSSLFQIARGITPGGACPAPGTEPFNPGAYAGTLNSNAGSYTPFYLRLTRSDYEQEITTYSTELPKGLLGRIAGIPYCPDAAIAAAEGRTGSAELQSPSCPETSRIGRTYSGYGVGLAPAYAPGGFYLAGPYQGRPLSVVAINPALVGPFDLGTIVIRSAIDIDPRTTQVSLVAANSDPIPHIFAGIPLHLRDVRVYIDRPNFMINPTNCSATSVTSSLTGSRAPFTNPVDSAFTTSVPFQTSNCASAGFSPGIRISLKGKTRRGAYPAFTAVVTPRPGDSNLSSVSVALPPSMFLAQNHIDKICSAKEFQAEQCPPGSQVGTANARTPLMDEPLVGPVYLRSSSSGKLPDLATVLRGRGIKIVLEGGIDAVRGGGIRGTFNGLPDAPVDRFEMALYGGKRGLLVNSSNVCSTPPRATVRWVGQNNSGAQFTTKMVGECGKKKKKGKRGRG